MRKLVFISMFAAISFLLAACGESAANNSAKPANASNAANAGNTAAKPAADTAAAETDVRKMLTDFEAALNKNDADAVGKFYADNYSLIDQNGQIQTKASRLEAIKTGKVKWEGLKFNDVKVNVHPSGDAALAIGRATGKNTVDGKTTEGNSMVTWIISKRPDGWKFVNAQITEIKGDAAKPTDKPAAANTAPANK